MADGSLSLDEPLSAFWAEYGTEGKNATTLEPSLTHRAGLPAFPPSAATLDLLDQDGPLRSRSTRRVEALIKGCRANALTAA